MWDLKPCLLYSRGEESASEHGLSDPVRCCVHARPNDHMKVYSSLYMYIYYKITLGL